MELRIIASRGISASMIGQVLIKESVEGWEELELEVIRDSENRMITVCFIENVDVMGVHTLHALQNTENCCCCQIFPLWHLAAV